VVILGTGYIPRGHTFAHVASGGGTLDPLLSTPVASRRRRRRGLSVSDPARLPVGPHAVHTRHLSLANQARTSSPSFTSRSRDSRCA